MNSCKHTKLPFQDPAVANSAIRNLNDKEVCIALDSRLKEQDEKKMRGEKESKS